MLYTLKTDKSLLQFIQTKAHLYFAEKKPAHMLYALLHEGFLALSQLARLDPSATQAKSAIFFGECYRFPDLSSCMEYYTSSIQALMESGTPMITNETLCARLHQYIQQHYRQKLSLSDLAEEFGYTDSYINRIFKKEYGLSPLQYISNLKLAHAKELLRTNPDLDIKSVASACGYEDARYFSRVFKNETGMTPSAWGKEQK